MSARHWLRFAAVSTLGAAVQAGCLEILLRVMEPHYLAATAIAVEVAVLHNFFWHWKWTWSDRREVNGAGLASMLLRFHLTAGISSLAVTLFLMRLLVGESGLRPVVANLLAIAICGLISLVNFAASDRLVFSARLGPERPGLR